MELIKPTEIKKDNNAAFEGFYTYENRRFYVECGCVYEEKETEHHYICSLNGDSPEKAIADFLAYELMIF